METLDLSIKERLSQLQTQFNMDQVIEISKQAQALVASDPRESIAIAHRLVTVVCRAILDISQEEYKDHWQLSRLYQCLSKTLRLCPTQHSHDIFKRTLGGCTAVIEGIGALYDHYSEHYTGAPIAAPKPRHAKLVCSLSSAMVVFLLETWASLHSKI